MRLADIWGCRPSVPGTSNCTSTAPAPVAEQPGTHAASGCSIPNRIGASACFAAAPRDPIELLIVELSLAARGTCCGNARMNVLKSRSGYPIGHVICSSMIAPAKRLASGPNSGTTNDRTLWFFAQGLLRPCPSGWAQSGGFCRSAERRDLEDGGERHDGRARCGEPPPTRCCHGAPGT